MDNFTIEMDRFSGRLVAVSGTAGAAILIAALIETYVFAQYAMGIVHALLALAPIIVSLKVNDTSRKSKARRLGRVLGAEQ